MSKIYVFVANMWGEDFSMLAVAEDGSEIAAHISSTITWGRLDMGLDGGTRKHDLYAAKYPDGYELEWVEDWKTHPVLSEFANKNKEARNAAS